MNTVRQAFVETKLDETFGGYVVVCYENDEYVGERPFRDDESAYEFAKEYEKFEKNLRD